MKKIIQQKNWWRNFFIQNLFVNLSEDMNFFRFFLIFENPVYGEIFMSYLRIDSIDYPDTSWV